MNIYEFINSKDVREYLQKIGYRFNPIEIASQLRQFKVKQIADNPLNKG